MKQTSFTSFIQMIIYLSDYENKEAEILYQFNQVIQEKFFLFMMPFFNSTLFFSHFISTLYKFLMTILLLFGIFFLLTKWNFNIFSLKIFENIFPAKIFPTKYFGKNFSRQNFSEKKKLPAKIFSPKNFFLQNFFLTRNRFTRDFKSVLP